MQFRLPELGEGVHEGELVKWRVKVGDIIKYDQPLCEVMTDKATVEIPSAVQGKVGELHAKEGDMINVGQLMLSFEALDGAKTEAPAKANAEPTPPESKIASSKAAPQPAAKASTEASKVPVDSKRHTGLGATAADKDIQTRVLAAPSTRRMAREMGIELGQIHGSGPNGRVMKEDLHLPASGNGLDAVDGPAGKRKAFPEGGEKRVAFRGLRKKISEKMRLSKDKAAHFTYVEEADATQLVLLRSQAKEVAAKQGVKLTYLPFVMKAMVAALKEYPILNATLDEATNEIVYKYDYNIALSVQTDDGLTAPVISDVAHKSVLEIAREIQEVVDRARAKKLTMDDFHGSTITLTNAGSIGGLFATPVINFPEVAILGFNKIFRKPVVKTVNGKEEIVIRDWTYFSISLDHRIVDGAIGAEFMKLFIQYIENPSLLLLQ
ncbi:MAG: dihydrolipoamide acetyltransferase family protein [Bdellovibrionia bacterium]